jgi:hypothetical protein
MATKCAGLDNISPCVAVITINLAIGDVGRQVNKFYFCVLQLHSTELSNEP